MKEKKRNKMKNETLDPPNGVSYTSLTKNKGRGKSHKNKRRNGKQLRTVKNTRK